MTTRQVALRFGVTAYQIDHWHREGVALRGGGFANLPRLPGDAVAYDPDEVERYLATYGLAGDCLNAKQAGRIAGVGETTIRDWIVYGLQRADGTTYHLRCNELVRARVIARADLDEFLRIRQAEQDSKSEAALDRLIAERMATMPGR